MDKGSQYPPQPPSGGGRGTTSRRARSVSTPSAPSNASSISSSVRRQSSVCGYSLDRAADPLSSQSRAGLDSGWQLQPPPVPPGGPRNQEEVARALQTIQEAYPFLAQSVAYHQQGLPPDPNSFPPTAPPQLSSQQPWQPVQPPTPHGMAMPHQTLDFGPLYPPNTGYPPASHPFPAQALLTPIDSPTGESSFQTFNSTEGTPVDAEASAEEKRRRNTAASGTFTQLLSVSRCHAITPSHDFIQHASESRKNSGHSI